MKTVHLGDQGQDVVQLQVTLGLTADGAFGPKTEQAVKNFQLSYDLSPTGVVDDGVWKLLLLDYYLKDSSSLAGATLLPEKLIVSHSSADSGVVTAWTNYGGLIEKLGRRLNISPAAICAIIATESSGGGFRNGKMVIRFENHVFDRQWGKKNPTEYAKHFQYNGSKAWTGHQFRAIETEPWLDPHKSQDTEWLVFTFASKLDEAAAIQSISMGAAQMMGFNYKLLGYKTPKQMYDAHQASAHYQILGMFDFIKQSGPMIKALRVGDWTTFARYYNGSGQAEQYGKLISDRYSAGLKAGIPL